MVTDAKSIDRPLTTSTEGVEFNDRSLQLRVAQLALILILVGSSIFFPLAAVFSFSAIVIHLAAAGSGMAFVVTSLFYTTLNDCVNDDEAIHDFLAKAKNGESLRAFRLDSECASFLKMYLRSIQGDSHYRFLTKYLVKNPDDFRRAIEYLDDVGERDEARALEDLFEKVKLKCPKYRESHESQTLSPRIGQLSITKSQVLKYTLAALVCIGAFVASVMLGGIPILIATPIAVCSSVLSLFAIYQSGQNTREMFKVFSPNGLRMINDPTHPNHEASLRMLCQALKRSDVRKISASIFLNIHHPKVRERLLEILNTNGMRNVVWRVNTDLLNANVVIRTLGALTEAFAHGNLGVLEAIDPSAFLLEKGVSREAKAFFAKGVALKVLNHSLGPREDPLSYFDGRYTELNKHLAVYGLSYSEEEGIKAKNYAKVGANLRCYNRLICCGCDVLAERFIERKELSARLLDPLFTQDTSVVAACFRENEAARAFIEQNRHMGRLLAPIAKDTSGVTVYGDTKMRDVMAGRLSNSRSMLESQLVMLTPEGDEASIERFPILDVLDLEGDVFDRFIEGRYDPEQLLEYFHADHFPEQRAIWSTGLTFNQLRNYNALRGVL